MYVSENFGNKIIFFDQNGVYLNQITLPARIFDIWITPAGTYLGNKYVAPQYVGQGSVENSIIILDGCFQPILELHRETFNFPERSQSLAQSQAEITSEFLARSNAVAVMGEEGRIYFGCSDDYAINVLTPQGQKLFTIIRDIKPIPYERKDIDFLLKEYEERIMSTFNSETLAREYLRLIRFPKYKPYFRTLTPWKKADWPSLSISKDIHLQCSTYLTTRASFWGGSKPRSR